MILSSRKDNIGLQSFRMSQVKDETQQVTNRSRRNSVALKNKTGTLKDALNSTLKGKQNFMDSMREGNLSSQLEEPNALGLTMRGEVTYDHLGGTIKTNLKNY